MGDIDLSSLPEDLLNNQPMRSAKSMGSSNLLMNPLDYSVARLETLFPN